MELYEVHQQKVNLETQIVALERIKVEKENLQENLDDQDEKYWRLKK
jgi:hypothetical protein